MPSKETDKMKFLDDLIVAIATRILRGVLMAGTALVYTQFALLALAVAMVGTVALAVLLAWLKVSFF